MENKQPAAGDLADNPADADTEVAAGAADHDTQPAEAAETETATEAAQDPDAEQAAPEGGDDAADADKKKGGGRDRRGRRKLFTGKRVGTVIAGLAALLFVGSAAFAGAAVQPYLADRAVVAIKLKVARTAANAITTLWTYTPENMDSLADRAATYLSGDFGAQYRKFVDTIAAPNKQAKITNSTEVTGVAVESLDGPNAVAIVYTNTTTTSPLTKNIPSMKYLSYRLIMKRDNSRWFVTRMTTITSLDLTPRL
ncbi:hypothetical protein MB901379_00331 [Mycobacterium basiliense]|uniref:Mammalian cell entry protein n=1 Tax=Mycobacterium basiliense TaxID=2094119 RepID=A0A3S4BEX3_9MYCO|nr:mammalian cell entry protein [Mycobacterium basiliense]VDM86805.1 hypothetical protein MB901379_00331 [Mycobacterium basiliense]